MNCHIAADLLPLYVEHLTSEETAAELEAHLAECGNCAAQFAMMQEQSKSLIAAPEDIKPLKAVKQRSRRNILIAVIAAVLFILLFYTFCGRGFLLRSDQIEMKVSTYWDIFNPNETKSAKRLKRWWTYADAEQAVKEGFQGTLYEMVSVELDGKCFSMRTEAHNAVMTEDSDTKDIYKPNISNYALYSVYMPPLAGLNYLLHKSLWTQTSTRGVAEAGSSVLIHCKDGDFAYDMRALAALADASPDGTAFLTVGTHIPAVPET